MTDILIPLSGIYAIKNSIYPRVYVGSTRRGFRSRWASHRSSLVHGTHGNAYLQFDWNQFGPHSFKFIVLEVVLVGTRFYFGEWYWINHFRRLDYELYNIIGPRPRSADSH
jgi:hypothetical protein